MFFIVPVKYKFNRPSDASFNLSASVIYKLYSSKVSFTEESTESLRGENGFGSTETIK